MKKRAVLICPGRGTYNRDELGYLSRHHADKKGLLAEFDSMRIENGQEALSDLDGAERFSASRHTTGDNASPLIYAASLFDARAISDEFEIVAVTGNSMGWYIALAAAEAVSPENGLTIVNTMGTLMHEHLIGGQTLYPFVDENWLEKPGLLDRLLNLVESINSGDRQSLAVSIHLGGMLVVAGNEQGLTAFENAIEPVDGRFPMRLVNHAAFHTSLQQPVAEQGRTRLGPELFGEPVIPLVDGRGHIWWPKASNSAALRDYTLDHQVVETYDFTRAMTVAAKEFAPDLFIATGPGTTLGGAIAQSLLSINWQGMANRADFEQRQKSNPVLLAMGRDDQRKLAIA